MMAWKSQALVRKTGGDVGHFEYFRCIDSVVDSVMVDMLLNEVKWDQASICSLGSGVVAWPLH